VRCAAAHGSPAHSPGLLHLLLNEDDETLGEGLRAEEHHLHWCRTLGEVQAWQGEPFGIWLMDWQLPDGLGLDLLRPRLADADPDTMNRKFNHMRPSMARVLGHPSRP
jgi:hypothetical protein